MQSRVALKKVPLNRNLLSVPRPQRKGKEEHEYLLEVLVGNTWDTKCHRWKSNFAEIALCMLLSILKSPRPAQMGRKKRSQKVCKVQISRKKSPGIPINH